MNETIEDAEKLQDLLKGNRFTMFVTSDQAGQLRSRPMTTQTITSIEDGLWFMALADSEVVSDIKLHADVILNYADTGSDTYIGVTGKAHLHRDSGKVKELWNPLLKAWFPGGPDDPSITLIHVRVERADYWEAPPAPVRVFQYLKAIATGEKAETGSHGTIEIA